MGSRKVEAVLRRSKGDNPQVGVYAGSNVDAFFGSVTFFCVPFPAFWPSRSPPTLRDSEGHGVGFRRSGKAPRFFTHGEKKPLPKQAVVIGVKPRGPARSGEDTCGAITRVCEKGETWMAPLRPRHVLRIPIACRVRFRPRKKRSRKLVRPADAFR